MFSLENFVFLLKFNLILFSETAMGVSKKTQGKSGYEYAMAVMK
jgi:hypothetical protein